MNIEQLVDNGKLHCQVWHAKQPTFLERKQPLPEDLKTEYDLVANYTIPVPQLRPFDDPVLNVCEQVYCETQNSDDRGWHDAMDGMRSTSIGDLVMIVHPTTHVGISVFEVANSGFNKLA